MYKGLNINWVNNNQRNSQVVFDLFLTANRNKLSTPKSKKENDNETQKM